MNLMLTILAAAVGSCIFYKLKVPAGALIGAIVFSALFNITTGFGEFPAFMKTVAQLVAGAFIGMKVSRNDLKEIKGLMGAAMIVLFTMIAYSLSLGFFLAKVTVISLPTALLSAMPAGMSDVVIISEDLGGDPIQTTIIQLCRMLFSIIFLPQLDFRVSKRLNNGAVVERGDAVDLIANLTKPKEAQTVKNMLITLAIAFPLGILGKMSGFPAGAIIFSVFGVAFFNVKTEKAFLDKRVKLMAQCITGTILGISISINDIKSAKYLIAPIVLVLLGSLVCNYLCGFLVSKICKLDISTSLFATVPAGVSDMALIATDMGGDPVKVATLQLVRYVGLMSLMPTLIKIITTYA